jgi:hopanoid biosynthesis associated protein HpnK
VPTEPRRLIISADDFGMSSGVNVAVARAHEKGVLTETSLMVAGQAAVEAVKYALATPTLGVGLHLVLVQGKAVSPRYRVPDLVDAEGMFTNDPVRAGLRYFFDRRLREQVRREIIAQLDAFAASGLELSHVDGHLTIHMHPVVLNILCDLRQRYRIRAVRMPVEPLWRTLAFDYRHVGRRVREAIIFNWLTLWAEVRMRRAGIHFPERMYGLHQTGQVSELYLFHIISRLDPGTSEFYCHPGITDDEIRRWTPGYNRDRELEALTSPLVRAQIHQYDVRLIRYRDLWTTAESAVGRRQGTANGEQRTANGEQGTVNGEQ